MEPWLIAAWTGDMDGIYRPYLDIAVKQDGVHILVRAQGQQAGQEIVLSVEEWKRLREIIAEKDPC